MANHVERQWKTKPKCTLTRSHLPSTTYTRTAWRTGRVPSCYSRSLLTCSRDLKPCNVLIFLPPNVDPDSRLGRATIGTCKLGDFGQCAIFEEAIMERVRFPIPLFSSPAALTSPLSPQTSCGTHGFRAPEMIAQQPYGPISDVFALGVIVCGLITGWYPSYEDDRVRAPKGWTWKEYLAAMLHEAQISEACASNFARDAAISRADVFVRLEATGRSAGGGPQPSLGRAHGSPERVALVL
jgi:serine/threonine protein kinase